ncbi:ATP-binding protein [Massilia glaciei]|uniref:histidine kinase n=1 Tax=Massilia glaciei TaxID=1524097 RepID=A0A2U2I6U1_9BURK|nr:ATP-binding protein [Massilia glaciei]PWF55349.1 HAMP domain-containing protein [Massilia glaciei]
MRLTIARKIALAVIAIVVLCVGTMAWVTTSNLQRGFIAYLNEMQAQDLGQLRDLVQARHRREGDFDWLRRRPRALRELLDQMNPRIQAAPEPRRPRHPDDQFGRGAAPPDGAGGQRPEPTGERGPDRGGQGGGRERGPPPHPPGARDPMGFAPRVSIADADGLPVIGPREFPAGVSLPIVVDGKTVGRIGLSPLRQAAGVDSGASGFLRKQLNDILWLAALLGVGAILLSIWLARHLLRPIASLRTVTARLARGEFDARAPLVSRGELAELAVHINEMAQALQQSEQRRRKMLADIAHELRTPLTVVRGELEALLDGIRATDTGALESLHEQVLRVNQLVDDLHQLTLADAGELRYDWQRLDLGALALPLLVRYRTRAQAAGLELRWTLANDVMLRGDSGRLSQILVNLLENSVRYTSEGGAIAVTLTKLDGVAELLVEDSAPGVPDGVHERLFERLYRVDSARARTTPAGGGSGLGLAICKALLDAHGGGIAASASPLGGLRMLVRIPLDPNY